MATDCLPFYVRPTQTWEPNWNIPQQVYPQQPNCIPNQWWTYYPTYATSKIPHKCPICKGRQKVAKGFYEGKENDETATETEMCKSCWGIGYIFA